MMGLVVYFSYRPTSSSFCYHLKEMWHLEQQWMKAKNLDCLFRLLVRALKAYLWSGHGLLPPLFHYPVLVHRQSLDYAFSYEQLSSSTLDLVSRAFALASLRSNFPYLVLKQNS